MFQDTIDSLYIVLQLVSGDRAHPGKVFTEASAAGVPRISFRRGESPWQLLFLRFFPLILASEVTVSVECHSDSCFFFPSRHQHIGRSECVPSLCKVSALVYVSPSPPVSLSLSWQAEALERNPSAALPDGVTLGKGPHLLGP